MTLPSRNLALEFVRVTEAAAMTAGRFMGRGDKNAADKAAVDGMRIILNTIEMSAVVVWARARKIKLQCYFAANTWGQVGHLKSTWLLIQSMEHDLWHWVYPIPLPQLPSRRVERCSIPGPIVYMNKIAVGPVAKDVIDIDAPVTENLKRIAKAKGEGVEHLTAVILDRPRHEDLIAEVRKCGTRIKLIPDGDVAGALMTAWPQSEIDVLLGIGGTPEGILAACGIARHGRQYPGEVLCA